MTQLREPLNEFDRRLHFETAVSTAHSNWQQALKEDSQLVIALDDSLQEALSERDAFEVRCSSANHVIQSYREREQMLATAIQQAILDPSVPVHSFARAGLEHALAQLNYSKGLP